MTTFQSSKDRSYTTISTTWSLMQIHNNFSCALPKPKLPIIILFSIVDVSLYILPKCMYVYTLNDLGRCVLHLEVWSSIKEVTRGIGPHTWPILLFLLPMNRVHVYIRILRICRSATNGILWDTSCNVMNIK